MFGKREPDFDSIVLLPSEKFLLLSLQFNRRQHGDVYSPRLAKLNQYGLIEQNYLSHRGSEGEALSDGTFSISDSGKRYLAFIRHERFKRYFTPLIVAFLTSIGTNLAKDLWLPVLLAWLQGLF